jgi:hypothetical protein
VVVRQVDTQRVTRHYLASGNDHPAVDRHWQLASNGEDGAGVFIPFQIATAAGVLSFVSTTTVFGTPTEVTLSEIALECFFPADEATAAALGAGAA